MNLPPPSPPPSTPRHTHKTQNTPQASAATSSDLGSLSMSELRDRCKARGLSVKGQRKELLARLSEEDTSA